MSEGCQSTRMIQRSIFYQGFKQPYIWNPCDWSINTSYATTQCICLDSQQLFQNREDVTSDSKWIAYHIWHPILDTSKSRKTCPCSVIDLTAGSNSMFGTMLWWKKIYKTFQNLMAWFELSHALSWQDRV